MSDVDAVMAAAEAVAVARVSHVLACSGRDCAERLAPSHDRLRLTVELLEAKTARKYARCDGEGWCANASRTVTDVCTSCQLWGVVAALEAQLAALTSEAAL